MKPRKHPEVDGNADAAKWRLFDQTVSEVRQAFADVPPDELDKLIEEAIGSIRKDKGS